MCGSLPPSREQTIWGEGNQKKQTKQAMLRRELAGQSCVHAHHHSSGMMWQVCCQR